MAAVAVLRVNGADVAPVEATQTRAECRRGLLGRDGIDGAMLLEPCRAVHTLRMRFAIDVAHLRRVGNGYQIVRVQMMSPGRIGRPVLRSCAVLEAAAGAFRGWGLAVGGTVEVVRG